MPTVSNPHDHFFRETFSRRDVAVDFVRHYLPSDVVAQLDIGALHIVKDSFIDSDLREHFSDLLYRTHLRDGQDAYVYVLFEHKSYPEPLVAFQLLRYMVRIWEQALKQTKATHLPPVVPVLVYHGSDVWRIDTRFQGLFADHPALAAYIPDFQYQLCDLSAYSDEEIAGEALLKVTLLILKHVFDGELGQRLPDILSLLSDLTQATSGLEYLEVVLRYLTVATDHLSSEDLYRAVDDAFSPTGGALMTTIAQQWIEQGVEQGIEQGIVQTARESVLDILQVRFGTIPSDVAETITTIDDALRLKVLRKQAVTVHSLAEFAQVLERIPTQDKGKIAH